MTNKTYSGLIDVRSLFYEVLADLGITNPMNHLIDIGLCTSHTKSCQLDLDLIIARAFTRKNELNFSWFGTEQ